MRSRGLPKVRRKLENVRVLGDNPIVTVIADNKKRVVLPSAKPGDCFQVDLIGDQEVRLTLLKPAPKADKARLVRGPKGYLLAVGSRTITQEEVRAAMDEFP